MQSKKWVVLWGCRQFRKPVCITGCCWSIKLASTYSTSPGKWNSDCVEDRRQRVSQSSTRVYILPEPETKYPRHGCDEESKRASHSLSAHFALQPPGTEPTVSGLVHFVLYCKVRGSDLLSGRCPVNCRSQLEQNGTKTCMGVKVIIFWFMNQLWFVLKGIYSTLYDMDWFQLEWSQHVFTVNKSMDLLKVLWWFHWDFTIWLSFFSYH